MLFTRNVTDVAGCILGRALQNFLIYESVIRESKCGGVYNDINKKTYLHSHYEDNLMLFVAPA